MSTELSTLLITLLSAGLSGVILVFFREKAKNLATKEDIGQITESVESIKSNYVKEHEKLKAQLSHFVSTQNSLHADTKKAIYEFWESMSLLASLCDNTRAEVDEDRLFELQSFKREIERTSNQLEQHQARLYFLIQDDRINDLAQAITNHLIKIQGKFELFLIKAEPHLTDLDKMYRAMIFTKDDFTAVWNKVKDLEAEFEKETEGAYDSLDLASEEFKVRAHALLTAALV